MQRVFRVVETKELQPIGLKTTNAFVRSVRRFGVLNPVLLAEVVDGNGVIELAIIDGNRRIRAAKSARLPRVPAVVLKATTQQDRARLTLMCNYMRSGNFHTESTAIMALAADEDAAADAARAIGLGPAKMQQLYRKIATMPEPVRQAMREFRITVSVATWVGAWPEGLQHELIELLGRRRYVTSTMMKDLREWYAERHPEEFAVAEPAKVEVPFDEWSDTSLRGITIPAPTDSSSLEQPAGLVPETNPVGEERGKGANPGAEEADAERVHDRDGSGLAWPHSDQPAGTRVTGSLSTPYGPPFPPQEATSAVNPVWAAPQPVMRPSPMNTPVVNAHSPAAPTVGDVATAVPVAVVNSAPEGPPAPNDESAERRIAFVLRLDTALQKLAYEGCELGIDRSVWVDRTMRAWDRIGQAVSG